MRDKQAVHPQAHTLADYGLGKLSPANAAAVEMHIAKCEACCQTLLDLEDDEFVHLVRRSDAVDWWETFESSQAEKAQRPVK